MIAFRRFKFFPSCAFSSIAIVRDSAGELTDQTYRSIFWDRDLGYRNTVTGDDNVFFAYDCAVFT